VDKTSATSFTYKVNIGVDIFASRLSGYLNETCRQTLYVNWLSSKLSTYNILNLALLG